MGRRNATALTIYLPLPLKARIIDRARRVGISISAFVQQPLIERFIEEDRREEAAKRRRREEMPWPK